MLLTDFEFDLPKELIARYPLAQRTDSRLVDLSGASACVRQFMQLLDLVKPGDLLVFNDTKVIRARLYGQKRTGGKAEILIERILDHERVLAQLRVSKPLKVNDRLHIAPGVEWQVLSRQERFYELKSLCSDSTILELIERYGQIPLPHYMQRDAEAADDHRYQTVFAHHPGSVAAPTAGLHFDETLLATLRAKKIQWGYLTLHIGAGTFTPVRTQQIEAHRMHAEYFEISAALCSLIHQTQANGGRIIAVGTTTLRALESVAKQGRLQPFQGETNIFIYPGYVFQCVDVLITNLHLPCSSLLMLVCAFGGYQKVMAAYRLAVAERCRFYSYGDAMWVPQAK